MKYSLLNNTEFSKFLSIFLAYINWPSTTYRTNFALFLKSCNLKRRLPFYVKNLGEVLIAST